MTAIIAYCADVVAMSVRSVRAHHARLTDAGRWRILALEAARGVYDSTGAAFAAYNAAVAKADADHAAAVAASKAQHAAEIAALAKVGGQFRTVEAAQAHLAQVPVLARIAAVTALHDAPALEGNYAAERAKSR
jgi:hypothetical protein